MERERRERERVCVCVKEMGECRREWERDCTFTFVRRERCEYVKERERECVVVVGSVGDTKREKEGESFKDTVTATK